MIMDVCFDFQAVAHYIVQVGYRKARLVLNLFKTSNVVYKFIIKIVDKQSIILTTVVGLLMVQIVVIVL